MNELELLRQMQVELHKYLMARHMMTPEAEVKSFQKLCDLDAQIQQFRNPE